MAGSLGGMVPHPLPGPLPRRATLLGLGSLGFAGCATGPFGALGGTPLAALPPDGLVLLRQGIPGAMMSGLGFALAPGLVATSAHLVRDFGAAGPGQRLRGALGDGRPVPLTTLAVSRSMDLALLASAVPLAAVPLAAHRPRPGERIWLAGAPAMNRAVVEGAVTRARLPTRAGEGFVVAAEATLGFSGGPAVNGRGEVVGMTAALVNAGPLPVLSTMLLGTDLGALLGDESRQVLVLHADGLAREAARLAA
ncbi:MAG TPA: serine protease [Crenalkalicoccus sp.]|nr:serine protease [Crenalkalicoccus sp.]